MFSAQKFAAVLWTNAYCKPSHCENCCLFQFCICLFKYWLPDSLTVFAKFYFLFELSKYLSVSDHVLILRFYSVCYHAWKYWFLITCYSLYAVFFLALALVFSVIFGLFLLQRIHDICRLPVSLFNHQSSDEIPLPYNVALCRKTLYQLLSTLLMSSFTQKPSPDQVLVKIFSLGINDQDFEVWKLVCCYAMINSKICIA